MVCFRTMPDSAPTPQFSTAEYAVKPPGGSCGLCGQPLGNFYYRVGEKPACRPCAQRAQRESPKDNHAAFVRAMLLGMGGAILGLILYSTVVIMTGWTIGYLSLAVGYIVAKSMMLGSRGIGGRRYQIAAAILTYAAVSMAAVPVSIAYLMNHKQAGQHAQTVTEAQTPPVTSAAPDSGVSPDSPPAESSAADPGRTQEPAPTTKPRPDMGSLLFRLAIVGLTSPFLELQSSTFGGLIGLVILMVGIRIAWRMAAGKDETLVYGPFENTAPAT